MRVKSYAIDQDTGEETFEGECDLDEAIERDDPEYHKALVYLETRGRYYVGGGAAQLFLLFRVS